MCVFVFVCVSVCVCLCVCECVCICLCVYLVGEVPQPDSGVVTGCDAQLFGGMSGQTPDSSASVAVQQQVRGRVLLPDLNDLSVLRPHQDLTLRKMMRSDGTNRRRKRKMKIWHPHLAPADRSHTLHLLPRLQLEGSTSLHLLIPELHRSAFLRPDTHTDAHLGYLLSFS